MGILILLGLCYVYWVGYWQNEMRHARRAHRWNRLSYCRRERNQALMVGAGVAAVAIAIYFS